ncbi:hypothetical protein AB0F20_22190 [Streptomyces goshikiensis]
MSPTAAEHRRTLQPQLEQWRGLATRYDKTATIHLAGLHLAAISICSAN